MPLAGAEVYKLSQGYRPDPGGTQQTPGLSDIAIWWPALKVVAKHETKTPRGLADRDRYLAMAIDPRWSKSQLRAWKNARAQLRYRELCEQCGIPYAIGGLEAAQALITQV